MIQGAILTIMDGLNAGKATTTDGTGFFAFSGLVRGGFTLRAEAAGYDSVNTGMTLDTPNQIMQTIRLLPTFQQILSSREDSISGGDVPCSLVLGDPCRQYSLAIHHDGIVEGTFMWEDDDTWLWFGLYRASDGSRLVESSQSRVFGLRQQFSTAVQGGQVYIVVVRWLFGARITPFSATVSRPN